MAGGCFAIVAGVTNSVSNQINKTETVVYQVTGTAGTATVTYSTWNDGNESTSQQDVKLPWTQQETSSGLFKGGTLTVSVDEGGGTAICSVSVDGGAAKTATASGALSMATCETG